jgi:hypothetical protein
MAANNLARLPRFSGAWRGKWHREQEPDPPTGMMSRRSKPKDKETIPVWQPFQQPDNVAPVLHDTLFVPCLPIHHRIRKTRQPKPSEQYCVDFFC